MDFVPSEYDESPIKTKTGTTIAELVTAINTLSYAQKDTCAIRVDIGGGNIYTLRQGWYGTFATFSMGKDGYTSIFLYIDGANTKLMKRTNAYGSITKTDENLTLTSWRLFYF